MPNHKDYSFVMYLLRVTRDSQIKWESTAEDMQYATSFKGKYVVMIDKMQTAMSEPRYWLLLKDDTERELLTLKSEEMPEVGELYELAERAALNVDAAIDEIMGDDDIPF